MAEAARLEGGSESIDVMVGLRIRVRRKALGVSQAELAQRIGLSFQQLQKYEVGASRITVAKLAEIAAILECSVAFLVGDEAPPLLADDALLAQLSDSATLDLLEAFAAVTDPKSRRLVVELARALASPADPAATSPKRRTRPRVVKSA